MCLSGPKLCVQLTAKGLQDNKQYITSNVSPTKVYNIYMNLNLCMCVVGYLFFDIQPEDAKLRVDNTLR